MMLEKQKTQRIRFMAFLHLEIKHSLYRHHYNENIPGNVSCDNSKNIYSPMQMFTKVANATVHPKMLQQQNSLLVDTEKQPFTNQLQFFSVCYNFTRACHFHHPSIVLGISVDTLVVTQR